MHFAAASFEIDVTIVSQANRTEFMKKKPVLKRRDALPPPSASPQKPPSPAQRQKVVPARALLGKSLKGEGTDSYEIVQGANHELTGPR